MSKSILELSIDIFVFWSFFVSFRQNFWLSLIGIRLEMKIADRLSMMKNMGPSWSVTKPFASRAFSNGLDMIFSKQIKAVWCLLINIETTMWLKERWRFWNTIGRRCMKMCLQKKVLLQIVNQNKKKTSKRFKKEGNEMGTPTPQISIKYVVGAWRWCH